MPKKNPVNISLKKYDLADAGSKKYLNGYLFTIVAPKYNIVTKVLSFGRDRAWKKKLVKKLPHKKYARYLDLACGTGEISFLLAKRFKDGEIFGVDINAKMLEIANSKLKYNNVEFKSADMCKTGFNKGYFDVITGGYALRNAPDIDILFDEISRVLKFGGTASFLDFAKPSNVILQKIVLFLLWLWGSACGVIFHGNPGIYAYISKSLKYFPDNKALKKMLAERGFKNIRMKFLFFGFIFILSFEK
jgi:ubiquinone/menaquinone biosynthesis methyltransferase